jgi:hypothetical protein
MQRGFQVSINFFPTENGWQVSVPGRIVEDAPDLPAAIEMARTLVKFEVEVYIRDAVRNMHEEVRYG